MTEIEHFHLKVCMLGDAAVGKTALIRRFVINNFDDKYVATIGTKITKKVLTITQPLNGRMEAIGVTLLIWDIMGQTGYDKLRAHYYNGSEGAFIVADLTRRETFENISDWQRALYTKTGPIPITVLANKNDLTEDHEVTIEDIKTYAQAIDAPYCITSAKTGLHVESAFFNLSERMAVNSMGKIYTNPVEILDQMVADFCKLYHDIEFGMKPFEEECTALGFGVEHPTHSGLLRLNERLRAKIGKEIGKEEARDYYAKYHKLISRL